MIMLLGVLLAVGVGQDPGAMQDIPCGKDKVHTTDGCRSIMPALAYKIQPPDKPCEPKYEYEGMTMPDKPGFAGKVLCAPIMHPLKESEYQEIMERLKWIDHIRAEQCPSLSWINGKCLPYCDEIPGSTGSCAHRNKPSSER